MAGTDGRVETMPVLWREGDERMSEYIITREQIEELNKAHGGMQILTSWLSAYAIFDTSEFPPLMKLEHLAITLPNVVRCRDCKHYTDDEVEYRHYCNEWCGQVKPDGFCAWGEKAINE